MFYDSLSLFIYSRNTVLMECLQGSLPIISEQTKDSWCDGVTIFLPGEDKQK